VSQPEALGQPAQHCHAVKRNDLNAVIERFYGEHVPENVEITITGESGAGDVAAVRHAGDHGCDPATHHKARLLNDFQDGDYGLTGPPAAR
jgi:hypothetical protein